MKFDARRAFRWTFGLFVAAVLLALLAAYSGLYSVAASRGHPAWMDWLLKVGLRRSVDVYSSFVKPHEINPEIMIPLGAGHFQSGCAPCHGAPGQPVNPIYNHMLPAPPALRERVGHWSREQLFWIVYHGLQFTGMPGWSGKGREDEAWAVVAMLEALPSMTEEQYRRYASGNVVIGQIEAPRIVERGRPRMNLTACGRCHGTATEPPTSPLVPLLGGQSEEYLLRALSEYRDNQRQSGFMEPVAAELETDQIKHLAAYYAGLSVPPHPQSLKPDAELVEQGRLIAVEGDPDRQLPPCLSCHGSLARNDIPRLAGQSQAYLSQQLQLWKRGGRNETAWGRLMSTIANRMSQDQIKAVTTYFATTATTELEQTGNGAKGLGGAGQ